MELVFRFRAAWAIVLGIAVGFLLILEAWAWLFPVLALGFEGILLLNWLALRKNQAREAEIHDFSEFASNQALLLPAVEQILRDEAAQGTTRLPFQITGAIQSRSPLRAPVTRKLCAAWHLELRVRHKSVFGGAANWMLLIDTAKFENAFMTQNGQRLLIDEPGLVAGGIQTKLTVSAAGIQEHSELWEMAKDALTARGLETKKIRTYEIIEERIEVDDTVTAFGAIFPTPKGLVLRGTDARGDSGSLFLRAESVAAVDATTAASRGLKLYPLAIGILAVVSLFLIWMGPVRQAIPQADVFGWFTEGDIWVATRAMDWVVRIQGSGQEREERWVFDVTDGTSRTHLLFDGSSKKVSKDNQVIVTSFTHSIRQVDPETAEFPVWKATHWEMVLAKDAKPAPVTQPVTGAFYVINRSGSEIALNLLRQNLKDRQKGNWTLADGAGTSYDFGTQLVFSDSPIKMRTDEAVLIKNARNQRVFRLGYSPEIQWVDQEHLWQLQLNADSIISRVGVLKVINQQPEAFRIKVLSPDDVKAGRTYIPAGPGQFNTQAEVETIGDEKGKGAFSDLKSLELDQLHETVVYKGTLGQMPNAHWTGKTWELKL